MVNSFLTLLPGLISMTMLMGALLILIAFGGMMSERSGIVNIGLEGMFIIGTISTTLFITSLGLEGMMTPYIGLLVGGIAGGLYALFHAIPSVSFKANQIISGTALNMFAPALALFLTNEKAVEISNNQKFLPTSIAGIDITPVIPLTIVIVVIVIYFLYFHKFGLRLRACGENPGAADSMGVNVSRYQYIGVISSGVLAGLAGSAFSLTIQNGFAIGATLTGLGYLGLASLIFGQWRPYGVIAAALFFAFFKSIQPVFGSQIPLPLPLIQMLPFVATIIALIIFSRGAVAPKALGVPYDKGAR